jgi:hypothetical protein
MKNAHIWSAISAELRRDVLSAEALAKLQQAFEQEAEREQQSASGNIPLIQKRAA